MQAVHSISTLVHILHNRREMSFSQKNRDDDVTEMMMMTEYPLLCIYSVGPIHNCMQEDGLFQIDCDGDGDAHDVHDDDADCIDDN